MGYFRPKYMRFELKKYREAIFHDTEQWGKIWINSDLADHEELGELSVEDSKPENYVSWHWRVMPNLKENWLVA